MVRLVNIHEIDEFTEVMTVPNNAITSTIISNIRNLDEKKEIERFVREILHDPNETPHGPTEIADVLTSHVHVRGDKRLAAFVLKGKSYKKVSSKCVGSQFLKLRQIPHLSLIVFGAIGHIQDDAQRDFVQTAEDAGCDYLVIDAQDWARLLIAYEKICPKDGTAFDETGSCTEGHLQDEGLLLEWRVGEKIRYKFMSQRDVSHAGAKRYSAAILLDRHYDRDTVRTAIQEATEKLMYSNYHRNDQMGARWGREPAQVVWLFIAYDLEDIQNANWVCRTCWMDPSLPEEVRPFGLNGNERMGDTEILWNDDYATHKDSFERHTGMKEDLLEAIRPVLEEMLDLGKQAIDCFERYTLGKISEDRLISKMQKMEPRATELYDQSGYIPIPPEECREYEQACQNILATIHDMFLYYSKRGIETWPKKSREWLMRDTIVRFYSDLKRIEFEEGKISQ